VGLWFEMAWIFRSENLGIYTNQSMITIGSDYTFDIGNGLNVTIEHLISTLGDHKFDFSKESHTTSASFLYPLGMSDQITMILTHGWENDNDSFFLNYEHQFDKIAGHVMVYHTPESQQVGSQDDWASQLSDKLSGFGIRIMLVYHY
jgi:hypothetical protein